MKDTKMLIVSLFIVVLPILSQADETPRPDAGETTRPIAVMGPLDFELTPLSQQLGDLEKLEIAGIRFWSGRTSTGHPIVLTVSGTGKVNTAMTTTVLLREFQPRIVVMTGTAGSLDETFQPGDVCISNSVCHHDMGVLKDYGIMHRGFRSPVPGKRTPVVFDAVPSVVLAAQEASRACELMAVNDTTRKPTVRVGRIACGDVFMASQKRASEIQRHLEADAIEMEGAALAQVCEQFSVPWLDIRGVCDDSGSGSGMSFQKLGHIAAKNAATVALATVNCLALEKDIGSAGSADLRVSAQKQAPSTESGGKKVDKTVGTKRGAQ